MHVCLLLWRRELLQRRHQHKLVPPPAGNCRKQPVREIWRLFQACWRSDERNVSFQTTVATFLRLSECYALRFDEVKLTIVRALVSIANMSSHIQSMHNSTLSQLGQPCLVISDRKCDGKRIQHFSRISHTLGYVF